MTFWASWREESNRFAPRTFTAATDWLERHYKEDFFLYVDTWDPDEPWDAPAYYTELYWPGYDGEIIDPLYGSWRDMPGFSEERVRKASATYMGEITMMDTWLGKLLSRVENMGLMEKTAIFFTSDHGFYFGEHGGLFGKMVYEKRPDGRLPVLGEETTWAHSPLYEEVVHIPLFIYVPGVGPGVCDGLTSVVDLMPTAMEFLGQDIPDFVQGESLLERIRDPGTSGREFVVSTIPFANAGDPVNAVDGLRRSIRAPQVTTVTAADWSLLFSSAPGMSELFNLATDPGQSNNVIGEQRHAAEELQQHLLRFMQETGVPQRLIEPRTELRL